MLTQQFNLNQTDKVIAAIALGRAGINTANGDIEAIRVTGELVQVRVVWRDRVCVRVCVFPFDKSAFKNEIVAAKRSLTAIAVS